MRDWWKRQKVAYYRKKLSEYERAFLYFELKAKHTVWKLKVLEDSL